MPRRSARSVRQRQNAQEIWAQRRARNQNQNPENEAAARREEVRQQNNQLRR